MGLIMSKMGEFDIEWGEKPGGDSDCDPVYIAGQFKQKVEAMLPNFCDVDVEIMGGGEIFIFIQIDGVTYKSPPVDDYSEVGLQRIKKATAQMVFMAEDKRKNAPRRVVGSDANYSSRFD
jgi:hypothetical protein